MRKVLVVEDSAVIRGLIVSVVEGIANVEADECENGFEALRKLPREPYALVITDINMPNINGLELLSYIRTNQATHDTPVLIVSSQRSDLDREKGYKLGANGYMTKPFKPDELAATVEKLLQNRS